MKFASYTRQNTFFLAQKVLRCIIDHYHLPQTISMCSVYTNFIYLLTLINLFE